MFDEPIGVYLLSALISGLGVLLRAYLLVAALMLVGDTFNIPDLIYVQCVGLIIIRDLIINGKIQ